MHQLTKFGPLRIKLEVTTWDQEINSRLGSVTDDM